MDILTPVFAVILGMFLTIGDGIAIQHRAKYGFRIGMVTWLVLAFIPLVVALVYAPKIGIIAAAVGATLSLLMQLTKNQFFRPGRHVDI